MGWAGSLQLGLAMLAWLAHVRMGCCTTRGLVRGWPMLGYVHWLGFDVDGGLVERKQIGKEEEEGERERKRRRKDRKSVV